MMLAILQGGSHGHCLAERGELLVSEMVGTRVEVLGPTVDLKNAPGSTDLVHMEWQLIRETGCPSLIRLRSARPAWVGLHERDC
jgi:hypothetical protein